MMNKLLVICGPTATGKTKLGIHLAKKFVGEIVSADSRQVYKGMDIGTGKDLPIKKLKIKYKKEKTYIKNKKYQIGYYLFRKIPVWLLDIVEPDQQFSVAHFVKFARVVIENIWKRGKLPIVVGGTGFWIKALIEGVESIGVPQDWKLRKKLSNYQIIKLSNLLKKIDFKKWQNMNKSDRNNPRRLIRAIEIALQYKKLNIKYKKHKLKIKYDNLLLIGLRTKDYETLYQRIDERVEKRIKQGVEEEVRNLLEKGYSWDLNSFSATGYRVWQDYFEGKETLEETIQKWKYQEHGLARRQMTWFKRDKKIKWFNIEKPDFVKQIENEVGRWYSKNC